MARTGTEDRQMQRQGDFAELVRGLEKGRGEGSLRETDSAGKKQRLRFGQRQGVAYTGTQPHTSEARGTERG